MKTVSEEIKNQVRQFVQEHPEISYTKVAKRFGVARHSISYWLGNSKRNSDVRKNWQKERASKVKFILIQFLGGCCQECGYHGCDAVLDFHHKDSNQKGKQVSDLLTGKFENALEEAKKCELLCCRCHREQHDKENSLGQNKIAGSTPTFPVSGGWVGEPKAEAGNLASAF